MSETQDVPSTPSDFVTEDTHEEAVDPSEVNADETEVPDNDVDGGAV